MGEPEQARIAGDWFASSRGFSINNSVLINYSSPGGSQSHSNPVLTTSNASDAPLNPYPSPNLTPLESHSSPFYPSHPPDSRSSPSQSPNAYSPDPLPLPSSSPGPGFPLLSASHFASPSSQAYPTPATSPASGSLPPSPPINRRAQASLSSPGSDSELYSQLLLPKKRGYPLWHPTPNDSLPNEYRKTGISIGDVGYLNRNGAFNHLFNVCCSADHPVNAAGVPEGFQTLDIDPRNVDDLEQHYRPASFVASHPSYVARTIMSFQPTQEHIQGVPYEVGAGLSFDCRSPEGALLILPEGGKSIDHRDVGKFLQYAKDYAKAWFYYTNASPHQSGAQSLYLITGCDKTRAWGVACFRDAVYDVHLEFIPRTVENDARPIYWFSREDYAAARSGADDEFKNQCVFLRGFKIALRKKPLSFKRGVRVSAFPDLDVNEGSFKSKGKNNISSSSRMGLDRHYFSRPSSDRSQESEDINTSFSEPTSSSEHSESPLSSETGSDLDDSFHFWSEPYHPSDVLNKWILSERPEVDIAITHDDDWMWAICEGEEMPDDEELVSRLRDKFTIKNVPDGLCYGYFETPQLVEPMKTTTQFEELSPRQNEHTDLGQISELTDMVLTENLSSDIPLDNNSGSHGPYVSLNDPPNNIPLRFNPNPQQKLSVGFAIPYTNTADESRVSKVLKSVDAQQEPEQREPKISENTDLEPQSHAGSVTYFSDIEPSDPIGGRDSAADTSPGKKRMTLEEREAAYNEARSRIFIDNHNLNDQDSSSLSVTSSSTESSVCDLESVKFLKTDSEPSSPVWFGDEGGFLIKSSLNPSAPPFYPRSTSAQQNIPYPYMPPQPYYIPYAQPPSMPSPQISSELPLSGGIYHPPPSLYSAPPSQPQHSVSDDPHHLYPPLQYELGYGYSMPQYFTRPSDQFMTPQSGSHLYNHHGMDVPLAPVGPHSGPPNGGYQGDNVNLYKNHRAVHPNGNTSRTPPLNRLPWNYGPGVSAGGVAFTYSSNGNSGIIGPRYNSIRKSTTNESSRGASRPPSITFPTPSPSSSSTSTSSRRTYTSNSSMTSYSSGSSSQHPLPARPDWAVGLKRDPILNATSHHHDRPSDPVSHVPPPHPLNSSPRQPQQAPPDSEMSLQSTDFPPLSSVPSPEKRLPPVRGAWNNPLRSVGMDDRNQFHGREKVSGPLSF